jgi:predicted O-methyltransferase YrrM
MTGQHGLKRCLKDALAQVTARMLPTGLMCDKAYFDVWQSRGFHVTVNHFYEPVPDTTKLPPSTFTRERMPAGVDFRDAAQLELLDVFQREYRREYETLPAQPQSDPLQFYMRNGAYEDVDAEILYCMVRHLKPKRIIEIGSGYSTLLALQACRKNAAEGCPACDFKAVEPYPNELLKSGRAGVTSLIELPVQQVPLSEFERLTAGDILFIDSSHVLKIGSDVQYEFLEILPRLQPGVHIHVHDIFIPLEYPESWIRENGWFWSEQYLLEAFLAFNPRFEVTWAGRYMHLRQPERLRAAFPSYAAAANDAERQWPASFWMRRVH